MTHSFPLLPLRDIVVFPGQVVSLFVGRDKSVAALEAAMEGDKDIVLIAQLEPSCDDPVQDDLYDVGVVAQVLQLLKMPDGTVRVLVEGGARAELVSIKREGGYYLADVAITEPETAAGSEVVAMMRQVVEQFGEYAKLNKKIGEGAGAELAEIDDAGELADTIAAAVGAKVSDKQAVLTERDPLKRLEMVMSFMEGELSVLQVERKIRGTSSGLAISGAEIVYDTSRPDDDRVVSFLVGGEPLDLDRMYTVVVTSFLMEGTSGLDFLTTIPEEDVQLTQVTTAEALERYLQMHSPVRPRIDGRWSERKGVPQAAYLASEPSVP